jgi:hypothetical protein
MKPSWNQAIEKLVAEIDLRHYSRKTLKHYSFWAKKLSAFAQDKNPQDLSIQKDATPIMSPLDFT